MFAAELAGFFRRIGLKVPCADWGFRPSDSMRKRIRLVRDHRFPFLCWHTSTGHGF